MKSTWFWPTRRTSAKVETARASLAGGEVDVRAFIISKLAADDSGDPEQIAQEYLAKALRLPVAERRAALLPSVRSYVGAQFSSIQRARRGVGGQVQGNDGSQRSNGLAVHDGDGALAHGSSGSGDAAQPGNGQGAIAMLTRQDHNSGMMFDPQSRRWVRLGEATVAQFEAAITWHEHRRDAHDATIAEYRGYIARIQAVPGALCLDDVLQAQSRVKTSARDDTAAPVA